MICFLFALLQNEKTELPARLIIILTFLIQLLSIKLLLGFQMKNLRLELFDFFAFLVKILTV